MNEGMIGGAVLTNWLAIVGVVSLMYWGWRIVAALQHRAGGDEKVAGAPSGQVSVPAAAPAAAGTGSIVAPLGGVVHSIDAPLGHDVAVGDKVATIEAMKMKTEVRSKIAGKVVTIAAKVNESVETGQLLMTLG